MSASTCKAVDLGILCYEFAAVWWSLLEDLAPEAQHSQGSTEQAGVRALKKRLAKFYKDKQVKSRVPLKRFGLGRLKVKNTLKLKAKAGQARCLMPFTLSLAQDFKDSNGELGHHRAKAMETLSEIFAFSKKSQLTKSELVRWRWLNAVHMFHYAKCGFTVQPKFHYFLHLPQQAERSGTVRGFWVYSDEAKNRQAKVIWNKCFKGHGITQQVLLRLEWLLALQRLA